MSESNNSKLKAAAVVVVLVGAAVFAVSRYQAATAAQREPEPQRRGGPRGMSARGPGSGPPTAAERHAMRSQMAKDLGLSAEQQKQMDAAMAANLPGGSGPPGPGQMRAMRETMDKILTPEQRAKMPEMMQSRMRARMEEDIKKLPESEQAKFRQKLDERMKEMRERFPDGPPFGGPPQ